MTKSRLLVGAMLAFPIAMCAASTALAQGINTTTPSPTSTTAAQDQEGRPVEAQAAASSEPTQQTGLQDIVV